MESRLSRGEEIVGNELTDTKRSLERFQGETKSEQDHLTAQSAEVLQHQQLQEQQDTLRAETRDLILEQAMLDLSRTLHDQSASWAERLKKQEADAAKRLKEQKEAARLAALA